MRHGTQAKIADRVGMSRGQLCDILKGRKSMSPKMAVRLEEITGISRTIWLFEPAKLVALIEERYQR